MLTIKNNVHGKTNENDEIIIYLWTELKKKALLSTSEF